ncbi:DUF4845 domain-containing protein [Kaarinaea lacus]
MNRQNQQNNGKLGALPIGAVSVRRQKGMTAIAMAAILALVAFFALIALRLVPIYLESFKVSSHIANLAEDSETKTKTDSQIRSTLRKRFQLDDVDNVDVADIVIERQGGSLTLSLDYEVRTPAIANVDMVVTFSEEAEVK